MCVTLTVTHHTLDWKCMAIITIEVVLAPPTHDVTMTIPLACNTENEIIIMYFSQLQLPSDIICTLYWLVHT